MEENENRIPAIEGGLVASLSEASMRLQVTDLLLGRLRDVRSGRSPQEQSDVLRHTCATLLLGRNVNPKLVQHLLGHASITMTLDRYSHWIPSMGHHAAEGMDEALR